MIPEGSGLPKAEVFGQSKKGFHYLPPKFNSKDSAFVFVLKFFVLKFFVLFLSLKQEMDNNF